MSALHPDTAHAAAVMPLPHRRDSTSAKNKPPVWAVDSTIAPTVPAPLTAKCSRHETGREGVCCKELRGDDERTLVDPDVVRDVYVFVRLLSVSFRSNSPSNAPKRMKSIGAHAYSEHSRSTSFTAAREVLQKCAPCALHDLHHAFTLIIAHPSK